MKKPHDHIFCLGETLAKGTTRIGRNRLPPGFVSFHENLGALEQAIRELVEYACTAGDHSPQGIVYQVVDQAEFEAFSHQLKQKFGWESFSTQSDIYCPRLGQLHVIESHQILHAWNRHGGSSSDPLPISMKDFVRIPQLAQIRNIADFSESKGIGRLVYEAVDQDGRLVIVQEYQRRRGLCFKTMYRQKAERPWGTVG